MYRFLIFIGFCVSSLSDQNSKSDLSQFAESFLNGTKCGMYNFTRHPRSGPGRKDKPMDCRKLSGTEDTPFMAIILNRASGRLICMGSIIDERHILTAYRCVQSTNSNSLRVLLGYFKAYWGRHSQVLYVEKILKHEHDVSILRLARSIEFSRTVKPIQLLRLEDGKADEGERRSGNRKFEEIKIKEYENKKDTNNQKLGSNETGTDAETEAETDDNYNLLQTPEDSVKLKDSNAVNVSEYYSNINVNVEPKKKVEKRVVHGQEGDVSWRAGEELKPKYKLFTVTHPDIKEFFLVGFPVSHLDAVGDAISKTLVYTMKEEKLGTKQGKDCLTLYQETPALEDKDDPDNLNRIFCTDGTSKLCWGCLGGPTLYKKEQDYIQVGVVGGANCETEGMEYQHIRVDINAKWISANSLIGHANNIK